MSLGLLAIAILPQVNAQQFDERFVVGGPFGSNQGAGSYSSENNGVNKFASAPTDGGFGAATNVQLLAGDTAINFVPSFGGGADTSLLLDFGNNLTFTDIPDTTFVDSYIDVFDIDNVPYAFAIGVEFNNGIAANDLSDLSFNVSGGTADIFDISPGVMGFSSTFVEGGGFVGNTGVSLRIRSNTASPIRQLHLFALGANGANDNVAVIGNRTLETMTIPEPSSTGLLVLGVFGLLGRRKRTS